MKINFIWQILVIIIRDSWPLPAGNKINDGQHVVSYYMGSASKRLLWKRALTSVFLIPLDPIVLKTCRSGSKRSDQEDKGRQR